MSSFLSHALEYASRGWSIIPIRHRSASGKEPACWNVNRYKEKPPDKETLCHWFWRDDLDGLAAMCGEVSGGLACRDFDKIEAYDQWASAHPELAESLPTVRTKRGYHVLCRTKARPKKYQEEGEFITNGYFLLPPSRHPTGIIYEWVIPLPDGPLPHIDPVAAGLVSEETERTEEKRENRSSIPSFIPSIIMEDLSEDVQDQIEDAIELTLPSEEGQRNIQIFEFCRALKGTPALADLPGPSLREIVGNWHEAALPVIGTKPFEDTWADFLTGWDKVKFPRGTEPLKQALERADAKPLPTAALQYDASETRRLVSLCRELQHDVGDGCFFLSCRTVARLFGLPVKTAWKRLKVLQADGVIECVRPGTRNRAARYRYVGSALEPATDQEQAKREPNLVDDATELS